MNHEGSKHMTLDARLKMEGALRTGAKPPEIAKMLGKCVKTVYNEIQRGLCFFGIYFSVELIAGERTVRK